MLPLQKKFERFNWRLDFPAFRLFRKAMMTENVGFIGGGNMSTAIFKGILKNDLIAPSNIWVSGPRLDSLTNWKEQGANTTTKNGEVCVKCPMVFLGIKPGLLHTAVMECKDTLTSPAPQKLLFVSMLAGIPLAVLEKELSALPISSVGIIRIMPNTPLTVGAGACLYTPGPNVTPEQCATLEKIMSSCGICEQVPETMMDSLGSLVGCGPAYMYVVIEALADGAVKQGVPRAQALRFAAQVVAGSGQMVLQSGKHPGLLKDEVCSPGGSTIAGIAALEEGRIRSAFIKAIEASTLRTGELAKK